MLKGQLLMQTQTKHESDHKTTYFLPACFCTLPRAFCLSFPFSLSQPFSSSIAKVATGSKLLLKLGVFCITFNVRLDHSFAETILTASPHTGLQFLPRQSSGCTLFWLCEHFESARLYCTELRAEMMENHCSRPGTMNLKLLK